MRTLIVNTKLGFHSGATSLTHTATVECRQEFLNKELFTQTFSLDCSCFRFLADVRTGDIRLYLKTFQPKYGSRETMRNAFCVEHLSGGARRRSVFFIYEGDLSCEYLGNVIIVIIPRLLQILRTTARTKYQIVPGALTNISNRVLFLTLCPPSLSMNINLFNIVFYPSYDKEQMKPTENWGWCHPVMLWLIGGWNKKCSPIVVLRE